MEAEVKDSGNRKVNTMTFMNDSKVTDRKDEEYSPKVKATSGMGKRALIVAGVFAAILLIYKVAKR